MLEYIMQFDVDDTGKLINARRKEELVRCMDCKDFRRWIDTDITFCDLTEGRVCEDDFCSRAERRAE